jgi:hypothetical protein
MFGKPVFNRILKRGSLGEDVLLIQKRLNDLGYGFLVEDGIYGPRTEDSVKRFQMDHNGPKGNKLEVDGIVGPLTYWALFNAISDQKVIYDRCPDGTLMLASLDVARCEISKNVREVPPRSNRGPEVEAYLASVGRKPGDAWCAAFVYWCVECASRRLGLDNPLKRTGHVATLWTDAVNRGMVLHITNVPSGEEDIPPGAVFCAVYKSGRGHTGFVERRERDTLCTIEGNTNLRGSQEGDGVYKKRRSLSRNKGLRGFIIF